jgi:hypothetical protein
MKTRITVALLLAAAAAAFAVPPMGRMHHLPPFPVEQTYLRAELETLYAENGDLQPAELTLAELRELAGRLSVARQKDRFVARSRALSLMHPGMGEMLNKDYGSGAAFLAADLAVAAGTLVGAYYLLPENLRFQQLDYLNDSWTMIRTRWEGHSFVDYLPTMAVMAGGGLVKGVLGKISSAHAGKLARRNIEQGKVSFEPSLLPLPRGGMMLGLGWRF